MNSDKVYNYMWILLVTSCILLIMNNVGVQLNYKWTQLVIYCILIIGATFIFDTDQCDGICVPFILYIYYCVSILMIMFGKIYDHYPDIPYSKLQLPVVILSLIISSSILYMACAKCHNMLSVLLLPIMILITFPLSFSGSWKMDIFR